MPSLEARLQALEGGAPGPRLLALTWRSPALFAEYGGRRLERDAHEGDAEFRQRAAAWAAAGIRGAAVVWLPESDLQL